MHDKHRRQKNIKKDPKEVLTQVKNNNRKGFKMAVGCSLPVPSAQRHASLPPCIFGDRGVAPSPDHHPVLRKILSGASAQTWTSTDLIHTNRQFISFHHFHVTHSWEHTLYWPLKETASSIISCVVGETESTRCLILLSVLFATQLLIISVFSLLDSSSFTGSAS